MKAQKQSKAVLGSQADFVEVGLQLDGTVIRVDLFCDSTGHAQKLKIVTLLAWSEYDTRSVVTAPSHIHFRGGLYALHTRSYARDTPHKRGGVFCHEVFLCTAYVTTALRRIARRVAGL